MYQKVALISGSDIKFSYEFDGVPSLALNGIDIELFKGKWSVILGRNGCGKSTLVKHFNALLPLQKGDLTVSGINVKNKTEIWNLRRLCGMVFQNPDNQFVSSILEEDIAFGLENYGVPRNEIPKKVDFALKLVGLEGYEKRSPHTLSGGQKQRAAIAGILALDPDIIILDEVTAMLDPKGRDEILNTLGQLRDSLGKTLIMITHYVEEALFADTVYLMQKGQFLSAGTPREILTDLNLMQEAGFSPPVPVKLYYDLKSDGIELEHCPLTNEELVEVLCQLN